MQGIDFEALTAPVSPDDPCGPDLDLAGDSEYLNFLAGAEGRLPMSFFDGKDESGAVGQPFQIPKLELDGVATAAKPLLEQTRDLRLLVLLSKYALLGRELSSFITFVRAVAALLGDRWDDVHPRAENGEMQARVVAVESIEAQSTVIMPLQFAPLLAHRRLGTVSYRNHLIATGVVTPRENEAVVDSSTIDKIVDEIEVGPLIEKRDEFAGLKGALGTILRVWSEKDTSGSSIQLDKVVDIVTKIVAFLDQAVARRDPSAALVPVQGGEAAADGAESETGEGATSGPVGPVTTLAEAAAALTAVAEYFGTREPSSPTLLLVRQASQLLGKSFVEVMRTLVPTHVEQAAINIGRTETFGLPIERLASLVGDGAGESQVTNGGDASGTELPQFNIQTRSQAMLLLDQVSAYFRTAEPSSPVPFLLERARDLGQRDFLSVLKALLPADALKSSGG